MTTGERTGDIKSLERALPIRLGVGICLSVCLGLESSISVSSLLWLSFSGCTANESVVEVCELLCARDAMKALSNSTLLRKTSSSGMLSGVKVPGLRGKLPNAGVTEIDGRGGDRIGS